MGYCAFSRSLATVLNTQDIAQVCGAFAEHYGFEYFQYVEILPTSLLEPQLLFINGFPSAWHDKYLSCDYLAIDPIVAHCTHHTLPVRWDEIAERYSERSVPGRMMMEARKHGLQCGFSIAVHQPGLALSIFSLASGNQADAMRSRIQQATPYTQLFGIEVQAAVRRILLSIQASADTAAKHLSERERQCLSLVAEGKTSGEAASILHIAETTVVYHLQNATRKLKASNRVHAVVKAIATGLIKPKVTSLTREMDVSIYQAR